MLFQYVSICMNHRVEMIDDELFVRHHVYSPQAG